MRLKIVNISARSPTMLATNRQVRQTPSEAGSTPDLPLGPLVIDIDGGPVLSEGDRVRLCSPWVGGVILFTRHFKNKRQIIELTTEIKRIRFPALLITVDQEGGRVQRFRDGFTRLPPAGACGRVYDCDAAKGERLAGQLGVVMAAELLACGVDLSFAPVLDVLGPDSRVIGDRAFHRHPQAVVRLAGACIEGMRAAGMGSVGKHFPGHGGVSADSHRCLPEDRRDLAALHAHDLWPYAALGGSLGGVMLAHVCYPAIDPRIPGYSDYWIGQVLRDELGFDGVVFSDDLSMAGAGDAPLAERCRAALRAGCDLLPVCNDLPGVDRLLETLADDPAPDCRAAVAALYPCPARIADDTLAAARENLARFAD